MGPRYHSASRIQGIEHRARLFKLLNEVFGGPVGLRGLGYLYQPTYRDKKTGEIKKASIWWWDPPGKHPRVSTGCRNIDDANAWRIQRLAELGRGSTIGLRSRPLTFDDLARMIQDDYRANGYRSMANLRYRLKPLTKAFSGRLAREIPESDVTAYIAQRRESGAAVATVNLELKILRRMFNLGRKRIPHELIPTIKTLSGEHVRMDVLSDGDYAVLTRAMRPHYAAAIDGLRETGWREQEVLGLEWSRVSFEAQDIRVDDTKTKEPRYLSFASHPALRAILERQKIARSDLEAQGIISPWVFPRPDGRRISRGALQAEWRKARQAAGVIAAEGPFIHGLRRKMAKELLDAGVSEPDAMRITGHKTSETFRRYAIRDRGAQDRALALREACRTVGSQDKAQKVIGIERAKNNA